MATPKKNPIPLDWVWHADGLGYWTASVPAEDHNGLGTYTILIIKRPHYCDRGKWHVLIEANGVDGMDNQEGFPRYFFKIENAKQEMYLWANERQEVKAAFYKKKGTA